MPITDNLYVDDVSVKAVIAKTKAQANQAQAQQTTQTTTQTYSDDVSVESILAEKRARIRLHKESESHTNAEVQQETKQVNPYIGYEEYYYGKRAERILLNLPSRAESVEPSDSIKIMSFIQSGTQLNPGITSELPKGETNLFLESWFENSPWGVFTPEGPPKVSEHPNKKWQILAGKILGEAGDVALWTLTGFGTGKVIATSTRATNIISKLGGTSKVAQATRGILKGLFIGGEAGKAMIMHAQGYTAPEIAIDIAGDVVSFIGFEKGFNTAVEPKVNELNIQGQVHKQSQHIVYGGREKDIINTAPDDIRYYLGEKPESIGFAMKGTGEKGWRPTVYSAKTKSISASAIDKQRGWVIEEGMDIPGGKGRVSWIGKIKKFMTSAEFKISGYNPEKPFIVKDIKTNTVIGGGRSVQISREILATREVIAPSTSLSGIARAQVISAIKSVPWQSLPTIGLGAVTILGELMEETETRKPQTLFEQVEGQQIELKPMGQTLQAQKEIQKSTYAPITTYGQELAEQIKQELTPQQRQSLQEKQEQTPIWTPSPAPSPEPQIQPQIQEEATIPIQTPKPLTRGQETPKEIPKEVPATVPILTGAITPKTNIPKIITLPRPRKRSTSTRVSRVFGSALWKKSGRKNKNKIFSLNLPKPKNPFVLPKKKGKKGGRKNGIF